MILLLFAACLAVAGDAAPRCKIVDYADALGVQCYRVQVDTDTLSRGDLDAVHQRFLKARKPASSYVVWYHRRCDDTKDPASRCASVTRDGATGPVKWEYVEAKLRK